MLVPNDLYPESVADARRLADWLDDQLVDVVWAPSFRFDADPAGPAGDASPVDAEVLDGVELVVSLGGDGTLLRAARLVGDAQIPILGLSYGHLGFLTCDQGPLDVCGIVGKALAGELHPSRRSALHATLWGTDAGGAQVRREAFALNEVVLSRGGSGKIVEFDVKVNGRAIDDLRGDGFVVASATGSTGYALSAGGPIVTPEFKGMVCVPIAPHTITARAFLTSASDVVELDVTDARSIDRCVFADGVALAGDLLVERLVVRRAPADVILLVNDVNEFYGSVSRVFYGACR